MIIKLSGESQAYNKFVWIIRWSRSLDVIKRIDNNGEKKRTVTGKIGQSKKKGKFGAEILR